MFDIKKKNFKNTWAIGLVRPTIWVHIKIMIQQLIIFLSFFLFFYLKFSILFLLFSSNNNQTIQKYNCTTAHLQIKNQSLQSPFLLLSLMG